MIVTRESKIDTTSDNDLKTRDDTVPFDKADCTSIYLTDNYKLTALCGLPNGDYMCSELWLDE